MNVIQIRGLEFSACHGVNPDEKTAPQKFVIDADIKTDFYAAAKNDDIGGTVNYAKACKAIAATVQDNVFNLIEKLAYECAFAVLENFKRAEAVTVTVKKPEAPMSKKFDYVAACVALERNTAYLSLGSSMGDKKAYLDKAVALLDKVRGVKVEKVSSYLPTKPYGGAAENEFLNCAVKISTFLAPENLLSEIHEIEKQCERVRTVRWGDRTLDIDIIFFGDKILRGQNLTIPHADYKNRDFVLTPLKEIAEGFICPDTGKPL
ncbi:MAG: 2-amino-4-hydroxy-6-hydroxymethyldihydropteridine diphosphokinase [Clostridia bacterium]|nr:2-amino-4-hydroxy-6-hydroxymethyldihydropteridine diphosphokinase [Clostridia bacterium]